MVEIAFKSNYFQKMRVLCYIQSKFYQQIIIQNIIDKMLTKMFLILAALLLVSQCRQLNITCRACVKSCSTGTKCYFLTGDGYSQESCSGQDTCQFSTAFTYNVHSCSVDLFGSRCDTGVCVAPNNLQICEDVQQDTCDQSVRNFACGTCNATSECSRSICVSTGDNQVCVSSFVDTCNWNVRLTQGNCPNGQDAFGKTCACCKTATFNGNIGYCSDDDDKLSSSSSSLKTWASQNLMRVGIAVLAILMVVC